MPVQIHVVKLLEGGAAKHGFAVFCHRWAISNFVTTVDGFNFFADCFFVATVRECFLRQFIWDA